MTKEQAIQLFDAKWYEGKSAHALVTFQLFEADTRLCMPFDLLHQSMETVLGRPVFTHEFACWDSLQREFLGNKAASTMEEILALIPEHKRILLLSTKEEHQP